MTGMERNSDLIVMASYAPLLTNVNPGALQWDTDLIGYDAVKSYGSPSYYAQVMFGGHLGNEVLGAQINGAGPRFFVSSTRDSATGTIHLKLVNGSSLPQTVHVHLSGVTTGQQGGAVDNAARQHTRRDQQHHRSRPHPAHREHHPQRCSELRTHHAAVQHSGARSSGQIEGVRRSSAAKRGGYNPPHG